MAKAGAIRVGSGDLIDDMIAGQMNHVRKDAPGFQEEGTNGRMTLVQPGAGAGLVEYGVLRPELHQAVDLKRVRVKAIPAEEFVQFLSVLQQIHGSLQLD